MRIRESPVSPLHYRLETIALQQINHVVRREIVIGRLDEIRVCANMGREIVPLLDIREVAAALSREQNLPSRARHLFQNNHLGIRRSGFRPMGCEQARCAAANYHDIIFHINKFFVCKYSLN